MKRHKTYLKALIFLLCLTAYSLAPAALFTVNIAADDADAHDTNPGDGVCLDALSSCTLRAALEEANATAAADVIQFANGFTNAVVVIAASEGPLPVISNPVFILGSSIDAYNSSATLLRNAPPQFTIDGIQLSNHFHDGLHIVGPGASGSVISALSIINFPGAGITVTDGADDVLIERNFIGVKPDRSAAGNRKSGVRVFQSDDVTIGKQIDAGGFKGLGNVISDNDEYGILLTDSDDTLILGNLIGISPSGTGDQGNGYVGIYIDGNRNQVGEITDTDTAGNFLAGNGQGGISVLGSYNLIYANQLGKGETGGFINSEGDGVIVIGTYNRIGDFSGKGNHIFEHEGDAIQLGIDGGDPSTAKANLNWVVGNNIGSSGQFSSILRSGNGQGINLDNGNTNVIELNRVINSDQAGIRIRGNSNNIVRNFVGYVDALHGFQGAEPNETGLDLEGENNIVGAVNFRNYFSGNTVNGATLIGPNTFRYNYVGVSSNFTPIGNGLHGVQLNSSTTTVNNNVIGASGANGIRVMSTQRATITNNFIGIDPNGNNIANASDGIHLSGLAGQITSGIDIIGNHISNNRNGIALSNDNVHRVIWRNNVMHHNSLGGADIGFNGSNPNDSGDGDEKSNRYQNYPEINFTTLTPGGGGPLLRVNYSVPTAAANTVFPLKVDLYWSDINEPSQGHYFIGTYNYPTPSASDTQAQILPQGTTHGWLTAVVRDAEGNSSEFLPAVLFGERSDILFSDSFED